MTTINQEEIQKFSKIADEWWDAKGKFKSLSASGLASWLIKSRKGNLSRIISSLNQQIVFNRGKNPGYARKMKTTQNIVRKRLGKKKDE